MNEAPIGKPPPAALKLLAALSAFCPAPNLISNMGCRPFTHYQSYGMALALAEGHVYMRPGK
ncbi:MAG: hypothetical protein Q9212_007226 [Teloschistes hypoglaucus]